MAARVAGDPAALRRLRQERGELLLGPVRGRQPALGDLPSRTKFQRSFDFSGFFAGSHRDGDWIVPASIAPSATVSSLTSLPK